VFNFLDYIKADAGNYKRLECNELLLAEFNCPMQNKIQDIWTHNNCFVFMLQGRKTWYSSDGSFEIGENDCLFISKGAYLIELFLQTEICVLLFFMPDQFISDTFRQKPNSFTAAKKKFSAISRIQSNITLTAYIQSVLALFANYPRPSKALLELKFQELLLSVAANPRNHDALACLLSIADESPSIALQRIMENNFRFNLSLEEYARLSNRSLSSFKRDFQNLYHSSPGKWLLKKRLEHAKILLSNSAKSVSEVAFASGFENLSHFSRSFRHLYNVTPLQVRQG